MVIEENKIWHTRFFHLLLRLHGNNKKAKFDMPAFFTHFLTYMVITKKLNLTCSLFFHSLPHLHGNNGKTKFDMLAFFHSFSAYMAIIRKLNLTCLLFSPSLTPTWQKRKTKSDMPTFQSLSHAYMLKTKNKIWHAHFPLLLSRLHAKNKKLNLTCP